MVYTSLAMPYAYAYVHICISELINLARLLDYDWSLKPSPIPKSLHKYTFMGSYAKVNCGKRKDCNTIVTSNNHV